MKFPIKSEYDRQKAINLLKACDIKKDNLFELKKIYKNRNTSQNSLMWCWYNFLEDETGTPAEQCHEIFKKMYCPFKKVSLKGREIIIQSTKLLDQKEFAEYLEKIKIDVGENMELILLSINDPMFHIFYAQYKKS